MQSIAYSKTQTATANIYQTLVRTKTQTATARISITTLLLHTADIVTVQRTLPATITIQQANSDTTTSIAPAFSVPVQIATTPSIIVARETSSITITREPVVVVSVTQVTDTLPMILQ